MKQSTTTNFPAGIDNFRCFRDRLVRIKLSMPLKSCSKYSLYWGCFAGFLSSTNVPKSRLCFPCQVGADMNAKDDREYTAVAHAEANNHFVLMDRLVQLGGRGHGLHQKKENDLWPHRRCRSGTASFIVQSSLVPDIGIALFPTKRAGVNREYAGFGYMHALPPSILEVGLTLQCRPVQCRSAIKTYQNWFQIYNHSH